MPLFIGAYNVSFGWKMREVVSLEHRMLASLLNEHPVELGLAGREAAVCNMLAEDPDYRVTFAQAFPRDAGTDGAGANRHWPPTANLADTEAATARPTRGAHDGTRANVAADEIGRASCRE